jgi:CBS domain-containing protein
MHHFLEWHASQYMTKNVTAVPSTMSLHDLGALFDRYDYNSFPVVDDEVCVGIVTKFDFLKSFVFRTSQLVPHYHDLMGRTVRDVMSKDLVFVEPETPLTRVLELMISTRARSFPVLEPGHKLLGMISRTDISRALYASDEEDKVTRHAITV